MRARKNAKIRQQLPLPRRYRAASRQHEPTACCRWSQAHPGAWRVARCIKKVAQSLAYIKTISYLRPRQPKKVKIMKKKKTTPRPPGFVITGINRLTGEREIISQEMTFYQAINIMDREKRKTRRAWLRLKAERKTSRQLTIKIEEI